MLHAHPESKLHPATAYASECIWNGVTTTSQHGVAQTQSASHTTHAPANAATYTSMHPAEIPALLMGWQILEQGDGYNKLTTESL